MKTGKRFYPEIREQSVQMIFDQERECSSLCACIGSIAGKVGCSSQTLKSWVAKAEIELGRRHGVVQSEQDRLEASEQAAWARDQPSGVIHHSDRGGPYLSITFSNQLSEQGFKPSVGRTGTPTTMP